MTLTSPVIRWRARFSMTTTLANVPEGTPVELVGTL